MKLTKDYIIEGQIVPSGTEVEVLQEESFQSADFSQYEGMTGWVTITYNNISNLSRVHGVLEIDKSASPIHIPFVRSRGVAESKFDLIGGEVDYFDNGFKITKGDITFSFFRGR